jgi:L-cysteine:1D-myo-inositol 2-amino-2-deoxy-alpha-D-glucopyranoside ligase
MVAWQGHKMSKSRGNLVFVSQLRHEGREPAAIRLALLAHHYRSDWAWTDQGLIGAEERLALWQRAVRRPAGTDAGQVITRVREHLSNDMQCPSALDVIDAWAMEQQSGTGTDPQAPGLIAEMCDALLGVRLLP